MKPQNDMLMLYKPLWEGETLVKGDEWRLGKQPWVKVSKRLIGHVIESKDLKNCFYRRKV